MSGPLLGHPPWFSRENCGHGNERMRFPGGFRPHKKPANASPWVQIPPSPPVRMRSAGEGGPPQGHPLGQIVGQNGGAE